MFVMFVSVAMEGLVLHVILGGNEAESARRPATISTSFRPHTLQRAIFHQNLPLAASITCRFEAHALSSPERFDSTRPDPTLLRSS